MKYYFINVDVVILNAAYYIVYMKKLILFYILSTSFLISAQNLLGGITAPVPEPEWTVYFESDKNNPQTGKIIYRITLPENFHQSHNPDFFTVNLDSGDLIKTGEIQYPEGRLEDGLVNYRGRVELTQDFYIEDNSGNIKWSADLKYQLCRDTTGECLFPQSLSTSGSFTPPELVKEPNSSQSNTSSLFYFILLAFIGGILLNVMPCVLPVLSIKAFHLLEQSRNSRRNITLNSLVYSAGIIISLLILAGIVAIIRFSGEQLGWGFQFQNPVFVFILTTIIFVFSLSMLDVFTLNPTQGMMQAAGKTSQKSGLSRSFFTGIFTVLVATPCTAPFLGAAMGFAFTQPPAIIILLFFFTGFGLALPFILLAISPGILKIFPKPGAWMETFKQIMGFLLLGTAVFMMQTLYRQLPDNFFGFLWFFLILALGLWLFGRYFTPVTPKRKKMVAGALIPFILIISSGIIFIHFDEKNYDSEKNINRTSQYELNKGAEIFREALLEEYRNNEIPVFVEFTASWCATCRFNHTSVLDSKDWQQAMEQKGYRYLVGDLTEPDPIMQEFMGRYGRAGVPVYLIFKPGQKEILLPELLNKKSAIESL